MIAQHAAARSTAPGHVILYRVGEFYEVLGDDAVAVSRALAIHLTRRRVRGANDIPMCGIPASNADAFVARLLAAGFKIALSEQPAAPCAARPLRMLTPATSVDPTVLEARTANNLAVALALDTAIALARIDLSTGGIVTLSSSGWCGHDRGEFGQIMPAVGRTYPAARYQMPRSGSLDRRLRKVGADVDENGHR